MTSRRSVKPKPNNRNDYVVVSNKSYGHLLRGIRIYFEGKRPKALRDDGSITFGKHILETLRSKFDKFRWIITPNTDSITTQRGIVRFRTSEQLLRRMNSTNWERSRDIKNDIVRRFFSSTFPAHFAMPTTLIYVPGTLARTLEPGMVPRLSSEDKEALNVFLPEYIAAEAIGSVQQLRAFAEIETLKSLAQNFESEIGRSHPESWWQPYIKSNILLMQQGYIKAIEKLNVAVGDTKFPDFCLVTHDNYLDILEIKRPDTVLLQLDSSRGNYYWTPEMCKAISQTENYIEQVCNKPADVRSYLLDKEKIDVKAVRPRGIILAGDARTFGEQKQRNDFRILSHGLKSITILTYDELLTRLTNYIGVLMQFAERRAPNPPAPKKKTRKS